MCVVFPCLKPLDPQSCTRYGRRGLHRDAGALSGEAGPDWSRGLRAGRGEAGCAGAGLGGSAADPGVSDEGSRGASRGSWEQS